MARFTAAGLRPDSAFGSYDLGTLTGIIPAALTANSEIFQFRWADSQKLCRINKVTVSASVTTTFFAAGVPLQMDMIKSTAWTVAGTLGTAITIAATCKRRTTGMDSSAIVAGDVRVATTAALGAGTKTLEANPMRTLVAAGPITASLYGQIVAPNTVLFQHDDNDYALILAQNEGFSIRSVAVPATGTWQASINVEWSEVAAYPGV